MPSRVSRPSASRRSRAVVGAEGVILPLARAELEAHICTRFARSVGEKDRRRASFPHDEWPGQFGTRLGRVQDLGQNMRMILRLAVQEYLGIARHIRQLERAVGIGLRVGAAPPHEGSGVVARHVVRRADLDPAGGRAVGQLQPALDRDQGMQPSRGVQRHLLDAAVGGDSCRAAAPFFDHIGSARRRLEKDARLAVEHAPLENPVGIAVAIDPAAGTRARNTAPAMGRSVSGSRTRTRSRVPSTASMLNSAVAPGSSWITASGAANLGWRRDTLYWPVPPPETQEPPRATILSLTKRPVSSVTA